MDKRLSKNVLIMAFCAVMAVHSFGERNHQTSSSAESRDEVPEQKTSESWMGVYMEGVKVGYRHSQEFLLIKDGKKHKKAHSRSWMKVSRLGGSPVEVVTVQQTLYDAQDRPVETVVRTKMSESETVIKAEIGPHKILFTAGDKVVKEMPYDHEFYFGVPLEKIIREDGLVPHKTYQFKILDPVSYSFADCHFEVMGREKVLILGKKMDLWHVKTQSELIFPVTTDEWIDGKGDCWKSVSQTSFMTTTSIRMPEQKALEMSEQDFDIAFSTIIPSNLKFENPQKVREVTFKISGISLSRIKDFPYDDGSQRILEIKDDSALIHTCSQLFRQEEAVCLPVQDKKYQKFLKPTSFCQTDDEDIKKTARKIIGGEKNSWRAAKKIAQWVKEKMTANYDVGFASATEILKNREGDCSEHTVLTVTLCRAVGIPARAAVGIMYAHGFFAYHMWPEVYVGRWIGLDAKWLAEDEETGELYTDATHIKFGRSLLDENIFKEMAQAVSEIIGKINLEVIDYSEDK